MSTTKQRKGTLLFCIGLIAASLALLLFTGCTTAAENDSAAGETKDDVSSSENENHPVVDAVYITEHAGEFTLVDVRTETEYAEGHIPNAINIVYSSSPCAAETVASDMNAQYSAAGLAYDDPIVVYCKTGVRATAAADVLATAGYTNVSVYEGSWQDWTSDAKREIAYE